MEIDRRPDARDDEPSRVKAFAELPPSGPDTQAALLALRGRDAAVIVWGTGADHRQAVVSTGSYDAMRTEALRVLGRAGIGTEGVWADIAPASLSVLRAGDALDRKRLTARRTVVVALATEAAAGTLLEPVVDAGIRIRAVATPAVALSALARQRRAFSAPGAIVAHVVVEERSTCIALVRDDALTASRELAWGWQAEAGGETSADAVAAKMVEAIHDFLAAIDAPADAVRHMCLCGSAPDLRGVSVAVASRLGVEVDTLDTLFAIDESNLPERGDEFRRRAAGLRLAWAAAMDTGLSINLVRPRLRAAVRRAKRATVAAGIAAGFLAGWLIDRTDWWTAATAPITGIDVARTSPAAAGPGGTASRPGQGAAAEPPPFEAVLGTILYSADRPIALIDGRAVTKGDKVRDAEVVQITPNLVVLRDKSGRLRRLTRDGKP